MRNPISWLISQFTPAANKAADAVPNADRFVCGTPHAWAEEQQQAAEEADKAQSYEGKIYTGNDAIRVMAAWRGGENRWDYSQIYLAVTKE